MPTETKDIFYFDLPIPVLKRLEPILTEYYGYRRAMFVNEFYAAFYSIFPNGENDIPNKEEYIIDFPEFDDYAIDEGVFDYKRYAPRKHNTVKRFDIISYMMRTTHNITFIIDNGNLPTQIEELLSKHNEPDKDDIIGIVLLLVAVIYYKYQKGELYTDIAFTEDMRHYVTKVRPEMLKLYQFLRSGISFRNKTPRPITLDNGKQKITLDNTCFWLTDLLDDYLRIYLGVNNLEEAENELKKLYTAKKGRKANIEYNLVLYGTYQLLQKYSSIKTIREQVSLTLDYISLQFDDNIYHIDENTANTTIYNLTKDGYVPKWKPKQLEDYNLSPNNPTKNHFW